ncbi:MAG: VWA-like domain-containing protein [Oscillospiraceae bacterium]|jgi:predicted metal-dependent peptidase|nr:VWA-like domain-containing protein [Oscillospiraceae bacterium]
MKADGVRELDQSELRRHARRLIKSRVRLLDGHGFYGLLLTRLIVNVDTSVDTVTTDGERVFFNPDFLGSLTDSELDFILLHEVLHIALRHTQRGAGLDNEYFDSACDIVVNSNILSELGRTSFHINGFGEVPHLAPDGSEGRNFTAEQLYNILFVAAPDGGDEEGQDGDKDDGEDEDEDGGEDGDEGKDNGDGEGDGAGDDGKNGTAGENGENSSDGNTGEDGETGEGSGFDSHERWGTSPKDGELADEWTKNILDAARAIEIQQKNSNRGTIPAFARRLLKQLRSNQLDWRTILNDFVQEDVNDYSFSPPDRRFSESPFFLPDFNETDERVENVLFMIDASGSMSDDAVSTAFAEIQSAVDQFGGKLAGLLGFFDAAVTEPVAFEDLDELSDIKPTGGGGTDFGIIFDHVRAMEEPPVSIIILTDGFAPYPPEFSEIPVLWLLNNEVSEPPWGKIARIEDETYEAAPVALKF